MKVNYQEFIEELSEDVKEMIAEKAIYKCYHIIDDDCGYNIFVNVYSYNSGYKIDVNEKDVYYTTSKFCKEDEIYELFKILDIISAVNRFIK